MWHNTEAVSKSLFKKKKEPSVFFPKPRDPRTYTYEIDSLIKKSRD